MDSGSEASAGVLIIFLLFQLVLLVVLLLGGIYVLYCLNKAASGLDRLATVAESWMTHQMRLEQARLRQSTPPSGAAAPPVPFVPGQTPPAEVVTTAPVVVPPVQAAAPVNPSEAP